MRKLNDRSKERWAFLPHATQANTSLAIFVHGFIGTHLATWGKLPWLLVNHADDHAPFAEWDYVFLGYDTAAPKTFLDIARLISTKWDDAATGALPSGRRYVRLALFGHSLGTLGIRQLLCAWSIQPQGMLEALHSVTLLGTPLNGSGWASLAKARYDIASALEPGSAQLLMLRAWLKGAELKKALPKAQVILGLDDKVVGHKYKDLIDWPGDREPVTLTNLDHRDLVKPDSWTESSVVDYVRRALQ
jgi:hypothetical protein